ncbi:MAG: type II secretion system protein [Candidatus Shapirobacteria bacterium]
MKNKKGFTLIELLVVISIMAILTIIIAASFSSAQTKGRDIKRKSELNSVSKALQMYYNDYGYFPTALEITPGGKFEKGDPSYVYMAELPKEVVKTMPEFNYEPTPSGCDNSVTNKCIAYTLSAGLENRDDVQCKKNNNNECFYYLYSPNFTPAL